MKLEGFAFSTIDWEKIEAEPHSGERGTASWRTVEAGNVRVRRVEYSAGYRADHWCSRGHAVFVLSGELTTELQGGRVVQLHAGQSYLVAEGAEPHRSSTATGATLFIVD